VTSKRGPPKVLISYRRSDSAAATGRIHERLARAYGAEQVFIDVDSIPFGEDFRSYIKDKLMQCDVVLVIIGPRWLGARADGSSRMRDADDPVRVEVETALSGKVKVVPVLVDGGAMPQAGNLPESLGSFPYLNAAPIDIGRNFNVDMDRLIEQIGKAVGYVAPAPASGADDRTARVTAIGGSALAVAGGLAMPALGGMAAVAPPWPPGVVFLTTVIVAVTIAVAFQVMRGRTATAMRRSFLVCALVLAVASSVYLIAVSFFVYQTPTTKERWAKGYVCTPEAALIYKDKCPNLGVDELRGAEYEAERLWTASSVAVVKVSLVALWLLNFIAMAIMIGSFLSRHAGRLRVSL
jgi:TIR domain